MLNGHRSVSRLTEHVALPRQCKLNYVNTAGEWPTRLFLSRMALR